MSIKYLGVNEIVGPLVFLEGVEGIGFDEMVEFRLSNGEKRHGRVIEIEGDKVAVQVFEGTQFMTLEGVTTSFAGEPMTLKLSKEILGRTFNGAGRPIDGMGEIFYEMKKDINGTPLNPTARVYPRNYIHTGISSIDGLTTLIRGQKLPIFSGAGMAHNELAVAIAKNAQIAKDEGQEFCIVFAAMGVKHDVAHYFRKTFEAANVMSRVVMFVNIANDPIIERILAPRSALTAAEYLAFEKEMHVLVILTDMTAYCEALREFSSSKGEIPGRKGFPGYLYSDLSSIYERAGMIDGSKGSVTQIPILTMPNDDITEPVPDLTGYITEGQIVLERELNQKGIFPPIGILPSLSRLMKDGIGEEFTRSDHQDLANQLFASYARVHDARALASVIGEDELNDLDHNYLVFGRIFEENYLNQGSENRSLEETLDLGWDLLSLLPRGELSRLEDELLEQYFDPQRARHRFNVASDDRIEKIIKKASA